MQWMPRCKNRFAESHWNKISINFNTKLYYQHFTATEFSLTIFHVAFSMFRHYVLIPHTLGKSSDVALHSRCSPSRFFSAKITSVKMMYVIGLAPTYHSSNSSTYRPSAKSYSTFTPTTTSRTRNIDTTHRYTPTSRYHHHMLALFFFLTSNIPFRNSLNDKTLFF